MFSCTMVCMVMEWVHSASCFLLGSSPYRIRNAVSRYVLLSASCSIGYPRYIRMPLSPSMKVILLLQAAVFMKAGS